MIAYGALFGGDATDPVVWAAIIVTVLAFLVAGLIIVWAILRLFWTSINRTFIPTLPGGGPTTWSDASR